VTEEIAPYLSELFNRSMTADHFPSSFKEAFITPVIKKAGLDATDVQSYRPISNLSVHGVKASRAARCAAVESVAVVTVWIPFE